MRAQFRSYAFFWRNFIFLDSDVVLEEHFLNEHINRHHFLDNIAVLSFKENISIASNHARFLLKNKKPKDRI